MIPLNIVYIHSHDTGRYVQPYGHSVPTPALQTLAEEGVLFRQAFCAGPTCSPSRAALLTGMFPHESGMTGLHHRGFNLKDTSTHLAAYLGSFGFETASIGMEHVTSHALPCPWMYRSAADGSSAVERSAAALDWLENQRDRSKPFLFSLGFFETHRPFPEPGPLDDPRFALPPPCFPDTPETRYDMAAFKTSARLLDRAMQTFFDGLDRLGLRDNTLVICTTDHGIAFPRMKCNLQDTGIGVMLMMRGPEGTRFQGGKVVDSMVSQIDLFPTICELCELPKPAWVRGESLVSLVDGSKDPAQPDALHEAIFSEVTFHAAYEHQRCVRTPRWKYIRRFAGRDALVLPNCDEGETREYWTEHGWRQQPYEEEMLFDLVFDPNETANLVRSDEHRKIAAQMREKLEDWMRTTDDPLLHGPVPPPPGAKLNRPDQLHFSEPVDVF